MSKYSKIIVFFAEKHFCKKIRFHKLDFSKTRCGNLYFLCKIPYSVSYSLGSGTTSSASKLQTPWSNFRRKRMDLRRVLFVTSEHTVCAEAQVRRVRGGGAPPGWGLKAKVTFPPSAGGDRLTGAERGGYPPYAPYIPPTIYPPVRG